MVQGEPRLSSNGSWDRLQPPRDPVLDSAGIEDGCFQPVLNCFSLVDGASLFI